MDLHKAIQEMASNRGWSDTTVMILLSRFLEDHGHYNAIIEYLQEYADFESDARHFLGKDKE